MERSGIKVQGYLRFSQKAELEELMSIVKTLPDVRTGSDIGSICLFLQEKLNQISNELKRIKHDLREEEDYLSDVDEEIKRLLLEQCEAAETIVEIPNYNERLFHKDDYRMDQESYDDLTEICASVYNGSLELKNNLKSRKDCQDDYNEDKKTESNLKKQIADIKNVYKQLMNAIKILMKIFIEK